MVNIHHSQLHAKAIFYILSSYNLNIYTNYTAIINAACGWLRKHMSGTALWREGRRKEGRTNEANEIELCRKKKTKKISGMKERGGIVEQWGV